MGKNTLILFCALLAITARAATPEMGKDKLRRLVKMPAVSFQTDWEFDPQDGFTVGTSDDGDKTGEIAGLRSQLDRSADAEGYHRLGTLYSETGDVTNAMTAWSKSVDLYRRRLELQSDDTELLADFGQALEDAGKPDEAESVLRRAVHIAPADPQCQLALGAFLDKEARRAITDISVPGADGGAADSATLAPDRVGVARKFLTEAGVCYDQAVADAPGDSESYRRRGLHRTLQSYVLNEIGRASGERKSESEIFGELFSPASVADLKHASQLNARDYRLIGNVALFEIYSVNAANGKTGMDGDFGWAQLPDAAQRSLKSDLTRLENLSQEPDPRVAAGALEILGVLQGRVLHETSRCQASLRRALALDPSRRQAWEVLAGTLARPEHYQELLDLCEDRVKQDDSARSHLLLAKAYEKMKRWDSAEQQVLEAVKQAPNDLAVNLSLAALLLRRSDNPSVLSDADGWLQRCDQILTATPVEQQPRQLIIDLTLTRSVFFALSDDFDTARKWAESVIDIDKENDQAREILAAIAY